MPDLLLDTNILIYLLGQHPTYLHFLRTEHGKLFGMSVLTYMEALMGATNEAEEKELEVYLKRFEIISLDAALGRESVLKLRRKREKNLRSPRVADTVIAQTALALNIPLVTNNPKDFSGFKNLKLIVPEESQYRGERIAGAPDPVPPPWLT